MRLRDVALSDVVELQQVFNEQVAVLPLCSTVSEAELIEGFELSREITMPGRCRAMHRERLIAAVVSGGPVGFAHVAVAEMSNGLTEGLIHFFAYRPGLGVAGQRLLDECERHLDAHGANRIWAFHKFSVWRPYHTGFAGISVRMMHVLGLFLTAGYQPHRTQIADVIFKRDCTGLNEPRLPDKRMETEIERTANRHHGFELTVRLLEGKQERGVCECMPVIKGAPKEQGGDTFEVGWVHVDEGLRRRGLGRYLLDRAAWEMGQLGYRRSVVSTNLDPTGYYTLAFYPNCGYEPADIAYHELTKERPAEKSGRADAEDCAPHP